MVSEYGANAGVSGSLSVSGSVTFKGESDVNVDSNTLFVDASTNRVGVGTSSPISALDVAGKIAITSEASTPSQPSDGQGYLYAKSDGKIYWRSYDVSETDLTAGGGGSGISHDGSTADGVLTYKDSDEATVESNLTFDGSTLTVSGDITVDQYIKHGGDPNTYLEFQANDQLNLVAGGRSVFKFDGSAILLNNSNQNYDTQIMADNGNVVFHVDAGDVKVGISETNPSYKLDVNGNIGLNEYIYHRDDANTFIRFQDDGITIECGGRKMIQFNESSNDKVCINEDAVDIDFQVKGTSGENNLLRVTAGNNRVGISTDPPDEKLHVSGNLKVVGDDPRIKIDGNVDSHPGVEIYENGTRKWIIYNNYANDDLTFKTNSNVRMTIAQDGVVGFTEGFEVGSDAAGDILYHNGTSYVRLAKGTADQVLTMNDAATAPNWEDASSGGSSNEYYHLTLSGRVRNTNGNLVGHAAYPYNAGDADWTTSLSSYVSNWTSGGTTLDATYANAMLYFTIGVAPAAMSLTSARIAYYMANDNMTDDYIWEVWKATPTSGTGYSTSLTWTRVGYIDRGGDPASQTFYAATGSISGSNSLAAGDLIGLTVHNPGDTYTNKYHGYHLVLRFTYS